MYNCRVMAYCAYHGPSTSIIFDICLPISLSLSLCLCSCFIVYQVFLSVSRMNHQSRKILMQFCFLQQNTPYLGINCMTLNATSEEVLYFKMLYISVCVGGGFEIQTTPAEQKGLSNAICIHVISFYFLPFFVITAFALQGNQY